MAAAAGLAALVLAAPTSSHPGHGFLSVSVGNLQYTPATIDAVVGDSVIWFWDKSDRNHSVTSDPGSPEIFDSDPGGPPTQSSHAEGDAFTHLFQQEGEFGYFCKVHAGMRGVVRVGPRPATTPPDTTAPALGRLTAHPTSFCARRAKGCKKVGTELRFTLGEAADVLVEVRRLRNGRSSGGVVVAQDPRGKVGPNKVRLRTRRLKPGRYRVTVVATDAAGNSSRVRGVNVRVVRP